MNRILSFSVTLILLVGHVAAEEVTYDLRLSTLSSSQLLDLYREMFNVELVVASAVSNLNAYVTLQLPRPVKRSEAIRALEKASLEQAGIVFTTLQDGRVSVTHNDRFGTNAPPSLTHTRLLPTVPMAPPSGLPPPRLPGVSPPKR